jgi:precorrin isomerase
MSLQTRLESLTARIAAEFKAVRMAIADRATLAQVDARIANVVGAAPAALDTLAELAAALSQDTSASQIVAIQASLGNTEADLVAIFEASLL